MHKSMESQLMGSNIESISRFSLEGGTKLSAFSISNLELSSRSFLQRAYPLDPI
jgi:hypothetical protein